MANIRAVRSMVLCGIACVLQGAGQLDEPTYGDNVYVNCQYRMAAIFPKPPLTRDITYTAGGKSAPARQFHVELGTDSFSVIIAEFVNGPAVDEQLLEAAAMPLRQKGRILFQYAADYDPGIPGRQVNSALPDGRQYRASVYMFDHRLYVTEANAPQGDFTALQFEQSISVIDANGTDLDKNGALPSRQYHCTK